jgi:hypothetical protein
VDSFIERSSRGRRDLLGSREGELLPILLTAGNLRAVTYDDLKSFANDQNRDDGALLKTGGVFRRLLRLSAPMLIVDRQASPMLQESRLVEVSRSGGTKEAGRKGSKKKKKKQKKKKGGGWKGDRDDDKHDKDKGKPKDKWRPADQLYDDPVVDQSAADHSVGKLYVRAFAGFIAVGLYKLNSDYPTRERALVSTLDPDLVSTFAFKFNLCRYISLALDANLDGEVTAAEYRSFAGSGRGYPFIELHDLKRGLTEVYILLLK